MICKGVVLLLMDMYFLIHICSTVIERGFLVRHKKYDTDCVDYYELDLLVIEHLSVVNAVHNMSRHKRF